MKEVQLQQAWGELRLMCPECDTMWFTTRLPAYCPECEAKVWIVSRKAKIEKPQSTTAGQA